MRYFASVTAAVAALALGADWEDAVLEFLGVEPFASGPAPDDEWRGLWHRFWKEHGG